MIVSECLTVSEWVSGFAWLIFSYYSLSLARSLHSFLFSVDYSHRFQFSLNFSSWTLDSPPLSLKVILLKKFSQQIFLSIFPLVLLFDFPQFSSILRRVQFFSSTIWPILFNFVLIISFCFSSFLIFLFSSIYFSGSEPRSGRGISAFGRSNQNFRPSFSIYLCQFPLHYSAIH